MIGNKGVFMNNYPSEFLQNDNSFVSKWGKNINIQEISNQSKLLGSKDFTIKGELEDISKMPKINFIICKNNKNIIRETNRSAKRLAKRDILAGILATEVNKSTLMEKLIGKYIKGKDNNIKQNNSMEQLTKNIFLDSINTANNIKYLHKKKNVLKWLVKKNIDINNFNVVNYAKYNEKTKVFFKYLQNKKIQTEYINKYVQTKMKTIFDEKTRKDIDNGYSDSDNRHSELENLLMQIDDTVCVNSNFKDLPIEIENNFELSLTNSKNIDNIYNNNFNDKQESKKLSDGIFQYDNTLYAKRGNIFYNEKIFEKVKKQKPKSKKKIKKDLNKQYNCIKKKYNYKGYNNKKIRNNLDRTKKNENYNSEILKQFKEINDIIAKSDKIFDKYKEQQSILKQFKNEKNNILKNCNKKHNAIVKKRNFIKEEREKLKKLSGLNRAKKIITNLVEKNNYGYNRL